MVLTLGWLGANKRHLGKYASWYSTQGYDTLAFISPASSMCVPFSIYATKVWLRMNVGM